LLTNPHRLLNIVTKLFIMFISHPVNFDRDAHGRQSVSSDGKGTKKDSAEIMYSIYHLRLMKLKREKMKKNADFGTVLLRLHFVEMFNKSNLQF
jgi:hypothetical protein